MSIPEWAYKRAADLYVEAQTDGLGAAGIYRNAFARYIFTHEQPPVDPIEEAMSEAWGFRVAPDFIAKLHIALVKHGMQITPVQRREK